MRSYVDNPEEVKFKCECGNDVFTQKGMGPITEFVKLINRADGITVVAVGIDPNPKDSEIEYENEYNCTKCKKVYMTALVDGKEEIV